MRILADQNVPRVRIEILRSQGLDVLSVNEECPGISDEEVLSLCARETRLLVALDKDFGELAFMRGAHSASGIILIRHTPQVAEEIASILLSALRTRSDWAGIFAVATREKLRMRSIRTN